MSIQLLKTEDCELITDRWGDPLKEPVSPETAALIDEHLPFMDGDESSFIARRNGVVGTLFEAEYLNPEGAEYIQDAWHCTRVPTCAEVEADLLSRCQRIKDRCPEADVWLTVGPHVWNGRYAIRAFVVKPSRPVVLGELVNSRFEGTHAGIV